MTSATSKGPTSSPFGCAWSVVRATAWGTDGRRPSRASPTGPAGTFLVPPREPGPRYALAFGQWNNKNVNLVLEAWALLRDQGEPLPLVVVGLSSEGRAAVESAATNLGLADHVTVRP